MPAGEALDSQGMVWPLGLKEEDPNIAGPLKNNGRMTGQYGKKHLGDRDEHIPVALRLWRSSRRGRKRPVSASTGSWGAERGGIGHAGRGE